MPENEINKLLRSDLEMSVNVSRVYQPIVSTQSRLHPGVFGNITADGCVYLARKNITISFGLADEAIAL